MSYESDAAYVADGPSFGIFFLLKASRASPADPADWVRLWSGHGDFTLPADDTDTSGGTYAGLGFPVGLGALSSAINGAYTALDFTLSGVDATAVRLFGADRDIVEGALGYVGLLDLDETQQPVGTIDWLAEMIAGLPRASRQGQGDGAIVSISLPVLIGLFDRNQTAVSFWSATGQRTRSADDAFCDLTAKMSEGMVVAWPR